MEGLSQRQCVGDNRSQGDRVSLNATSNGLNLVVDTLVQCRTFGVGEVAELLTTGVQQLNTVSRNRDLTVSNSQLSFGTDSADSNSGLSRKVNSVVVGTFVDELKASNLTVSVDAASLVALGDIFTSFKLTDNVGEQQGGGSRASLNQTTSTGNLTSYDITDGPLGLWVGNADNVDLSKN